MSELRIGPGKGMLIGKYQITQETLIFEYKFKKKMIRVQFPLSADAGAPTITIE